MFTRVTMQILSLVTLAISIVINIWHAYVVKNANPSNANPFRSKACCDKQQLSVISKHGTVIFPVASYTACILFTASRLPAVLVFWLPPSDAMCRLYFQLGGLFFYPHKLALYTYLFARARLTAHLIKPCVYKTLIVLNTSIIIFIILGNLVGGGRLIPGTGYICAMEDARLWNLIVLCIGLNDFGVNVALVIIFIRPVWSWGQQLRAGDSEQELQGIQSDAVTVDKTIQRNILMISLWSIVACFTTLCTTMTIGLTGDPRMIVIMASIDGAINCIVIIQQYKYFTDPNTAGFIMTSSMKSKGLDDISSGLKSLTVLSSTPVDEMGGQHDETQANN